MNERDLRSEWVELSNGWIREAREGRNPTREGLLDRYMLEACGEVGGLSILDCGCGEGRFSRMLSDLGAGFVLGLDNCGPMIEAARELRRDAVEYRQADVRDLGFIEDGSFDIAVSYLNQCDLPDIEANNTEVYRVLREGGRFIVANLHPMRSAVGGWSRTADGDKEHVILDRYFDEGKRHWRMMGVDFTNYHRSLGTCIGSYLRVGFQVSGIIEPTLTAEQLCEYPELHDETRVPNFIVYVLDRPVGTVKAPV